MWNYEKVFQSDGSYKIKELDLRDNSSRFIDEQQVDYQAWLTKGNTPTDVAYVEPPEVPYETRLTEAKNRKLREVKSAWENADNGPLHTEIMIGEDELVIQYSAYDRDIWAKSLLAAVLTGIENGSLVVLKSPLDPSFDPSVDNNPTGNQITYLEYINIGLGTLPSRVFLVVSQQTINIRDYYNNFHTITLQQVQEASVKQNLQVEKDLYKKWELENLINVKETIEEVDAIKW
jgi:hypothetical protein